MTDTAVVNQPTLVSSQLYNSDNQIREQRLENSQSNLENKANHPSFDNNMQGVSLGLRILCYLFGRHSFVKRMQQAEQMLLKSNEETQEDFVKKSIQAGQEKYGQDKKSRK